MKVFVTGAGGYIGGSVAAALIKRGHQVRGLTRSATGAEQLKSHGIDPVVGELDDSCLLMQEASKADMVINSANADHRGAVKALISGLNQSGKRLIHTSGTSIVGDDARGDFCAEVISSEETPLAIDPRKQARRDIDLMVMDAAKQKVHSTVIIPSLIYGHGTGVNKHSIQVPFLVENALAVGSVQIVGQGLNTWSNIHIDDLVNLYLAVSDQAPPGSFYFAENGEAAFSDVAEAISRRFSIPHIEHLNVDEAVKRWGAARALFTFGSNSRVRSARAKRELDWRPVHISVQNWILAGYQSQ
jgi:nucleoside-diphosphate-sugar epimerase